MAEILNVRMFSYLKHVLICEAIFLNCFHQNNFINACENGRLDQAHQLLRNGADVNSWSVVRIEMESYLLGLAVGGWGGESSGYCPFICCCYTVCIEPLYLVVIVAVYSLSIFFNFMLLVWRNGSYDGLREWPY